jgi:hypothetical protein
LVAVNTSAWSIPVSRSSESEAPLVRLVVGEERVLLDVQLFLDYGTERDALRVARHALRQAPDHAVEGRREEQRLAALRHARHDGVDLLLEPQVEHPVGLVQHQELDAREVHRAAVEVVLEAAGRGDDDVDRLLQRLELQPVGHATDETGRVYALAGCVAVRRLLHLHRQLARGREHQHARAPARQARRRAQALQPRQHEGGGLAASRLRRNQQVAPRQHRRDRRALHRRRLGIAERREGRKKGRIQTELREAHGFSLVGAKP